jgi:hypothetical protein
VNGIVLHAPDETIERQARKAGVPVTVTPDGSPYERTLYVEPGVAVPWTLVDAGFRALDKWDAAAPLGGVLAADIGTQAERERTAAIVRDLRVPVYACELLFARSGELVIAWRRECDDGGHPRLAFLRALYQVKPLFLALPRTWIEGQAPAPAQTERPRRAKGCVNLVRLEIAPGRYVSCRPDELETYRERFARLKAGRR